MNILWHCPALGLKWKHLFQSCGHCWDFQIWGHIECSTFTESSFRIWNSSAGILSPLLASFVVILPKAHLTSHSRIFGSRWMIIPSCLSRSLRSSYYLLLLLGLYQFCPLLCPSLYDCSPGISIYLEEISSLFYCFSLFLCIVHWGRLSYLSLLFFGTLHSYGYIFCFLLCLLLLFFSQLFVRPPQTTFLPFCISSWRWFWPLPPVQCYKPPSIILQAFCLSDLIPGICLSLPLYNCKGFDLGHTWMDYWKFSLLSSI